MQTIDFQYLPIKTGDRVLDLGCGQGRHAIAALYHSALDNTVLDNSALDSSSSDNSTSDNSASGNPALDNTALNKAADTEVFYLDLNPKDLKHARASIRDFFQLTDNTVNTHIKHQAICGDGTQLPFTSASFDHVICSEVLEHIPEYQQVIAEIQRILKPNGYFAVSVPRYWPERICWWLSTAYHQVEGGHIRIFRKNKLKRDLENSKNLDFLASHGAHAIHVPYWWLRCLFWRFGENFWPTRQYHKFLCWDLLKQPKLTQWLDKRLNPFMGKSIVLYYRKR